MYVASMRGPGSMTCSIAPTQEGRGGSLSKNTELYREWNFKKRNFIASRLYISLSPPSWQHPQLQP